MENITLMDVFNFCVKHLIELIAFISIFIEITPIKIKPISFLLNLINKSVREDISKLDTSIKSNIDEVKNEFIKDIKEVKERQNLEEQKIMELIKTNEMNEIARIRWEIIEFSNSINNDQKHVRDEYRHIKDENRRYHELIEKYNMNNGIIDEEMEKINRHYEQHKESANVYF